VKGVLFVSWPFQVWGEQAKTRAQGNISLCETGKEGGRKEKRLFGLAPKVRGKYPTQEA